MKGKIAIVGGGRHSLLTSIQLNEAYQQGRADAFNEILNEMRKTPFASDKATFVKKYIEEQLKEQK